MGYRIDTPYVLEEKVDRLLACVQNRIIDAEHKTGYRGLRRASWQLKPTLARFVDKLKRAQRLDTKGRNPYTRVRRELHKKFRDNVLINNDVPPDKIADVDFLWKIGQHHGLPTPLLDWTHSPYIGLFFALIDSDDDAVDRDSEPRCLWVLNIDLLEHLNQQIRMEIRPRLKKQIRDSATLGEQIPEMHIVDQIDGYNRRLAYQQGFFTRHVFYDSFETWAKRIADEILHKSYDVPLLTKLVFEVNSEQQSRLLRTLDKMNVNSRVLFPDIKGSVDDARLSIEHRVQSKFISFSATRDKKR
jgi:FRG domain